MSTGGSPQVLTSAEVAQTLAQLAGQLAQLAAQIAPESAQIASDLRMSLSPLALGFEGFGTPRTNPHRGAKDSKRYAYPGAFLEFWAAYPLKRDKGKALPAWERAIRRIVGANEGASYGATGANLGALVGANRILVDGAIRYANDPNRVDQFTKYPEGWLNGDGWEDEPLPSRNGHVPRHDAARETFEQAQRLREVEDREAIGGAGTGGAPRSSLPSGTP